MSGIEYKNFLRAKEKIESLQREADENKGELKALYASLEKEFLVKNLDQAKDMLSRIAENIEEVNSKIKEMKELLLSKYGNLLSDL